MGIRRSTTFGRLKRNATFEVATTQDGFAVIDVSTGHQVSNSVRSQHACKTTCDDLNNAATYGPAVLARALGAT